MATHCTKKANKKRREIMYRKDKKERQKKLEWTSEENNKELRKEKDNVRGKHN